MNQPDLGLKVSELRLQKNLTQEQLAEYCEVSKRTIQRTLAPHFVWCSAVSRAAKKKKAVRSTNRAGRRHQKNIDISRQYEIMM